MGNKTAEQIFASRVVEGSTTFTQAVVSVQNPGDLIISRNPERVSLVITNNSVVNMELQFSLDTQNAYKLRLAANGGTIMLNLEDGQFVTTSVYLSNLLLLPLDIHVLSVFRDNITEII